MSSTPTPRVASPIALPFALAVLLCAAVYFVGSPSISAPWIQGDEYMFIAGNADVTGAGRNDSLIERCSGIFRSVHNDLYQPIPICTYAIEWSIWGPDRVAGMVRQIDVLIHALNALLVWLTLLTVLRTASPTAESSALLLLTWALALLWAMHPTIAPAYAADMGRTHLLSATFALLSLLCHIRALTTGDMRWFAGSVGLLLAAMLCKPIAAWFVIVAAVEAMILGPRAVLRSARVLLIAAICAFFAWLAFKTTRTAGLIDDASLALFGGPVERSLVGVWYYIHNILVPIDLATWYLPDPRTSLGYWPAWVGLAAALASVSGVAMSLRRVRLGVGAVGVIWAWAAILPLLGIVGARVAAAQDRYLYLPLIGLLLAGAGAVVRLAPTAGALRAVAAIVTVGGVVLAPISFADVNDCRSTLRRADRVVARHPGDPRALELLAIGFEFTSRHDTPESRTTTQPDLFAAFVKTLQDAAAAAEQRPECFRDKADRAAFHRRLAFQFLGAQLCDESLKQALRAGDFQPDHPMTLTRLAHAYRCLRDYDKALAVYGRLERVLPDDRVSKALRLTEFGDLLLNVYGRPDLARARYLAALETGTQLSHTRVGLARCEVLVGKGEEGFQQASIVLQQEPGNLDAMLVIAMYHLRSHNFNEAETAYRMIIAADPTEYEALRGFDAAVGQSGRWVDAAEAWERAMQAQPNEPAFRAFAAWAATCANEPAATKWVAELLAADPNHVFACLSQMLSALRSSDLSQALSWIDKAAAGKPIFEARELIRAEGVLRVMRARNELPPESEIARAALLQRIGNIAAARAALETYLSGDANAASKAIAVSMLEKLPTSQPGTATRAAPGGE